MSGSSYPNAVGSFFFRFGGGLSLHSVHSLIFSNPVDISVARFTTSCLMNLLSDDLPVDLAGCPLVPPT
jgi:hypothetical protein